MLSTYSPEDTFSREHSRYVVDVLTHAGFNVDGAVESLDGDGVPTCGLILKLRTTGRDVLGETVRAFEKVLDALENER